MLGLLMWNIMYTGVLVLPALEKTTIVYFADALGSLKYPDNVEVYTAEMVKECWLKRAGLTLTDEKRKRYK